MKTVIVDIDGTIANAQHRLCYVMTRPKNWPAFEAASVHDEIISQTVTVVRLLKQSGTKVIILTARNINMKKMTEEWLKKNDIHYDALYMRRDKDYREDDVVKRELLYEIISEHGPVDAAFEDRQRVAKMFESEGIFTFNVGQGRDY